MTKYRLKIKYPISEELALDFLCLYSDRNSDIVIYRDSPENKTHVTVRFLPLEREHMVDCPREWLEEIKEESEFEKFCESEAGRKLEKELLFDCWKASEKNTHKLYSELMKHSQHYIHLKENGGNSYEIDMASTFIKIEVENIKHAEN